MFKEYRRRLLRQPAASVYAARWATKQHASRVPNRNQNLPQCVRASREVDDVGKHQQRKTLQKTKKPQKPKSHKKSIRQPAAQLDYGPLLSSTRIYV